MYELSHWRQPAVAMLAALLLSGYAVKLEEASEATRPAEVLAAGPYGGHWAASEAARGEAGAVDPHRPPRVYKVFFADDQASLTDVGRRAIDAAVARWRDHGAPIRLAGRSGREAHDRALTEHRLHRVRSALIERGIDPARLTGEAVAESERAVSARSGIRPPHSGAVTIVAR